MWPRRRTAQIPATRPKVALLLGQTGLRNTPGCRVHRHRSACLEGSRRVEVNHPRHLVTGNQRFPNGKDARSAVSVVMQVGPTDPDIAHPQPHLVGTRLGTGNLLSPHVLPCMDPYGLHAVQYPILTRAPSVTGSDAVTDGRRTDHRR